MPRRSHRCPRWELQSVPEEAEPAIKGTEAASEPSTSEAEFPARTGRRAEPCSKQAEGVSAGFDEDPSANSSSSSGDGGVDAVGGVIVRQVDDDAVLRGAFPQRHHG